MRRPKVDCRYPTAECLFRWGGFFMQYCEITLSQMQFTFPQLLIQIREKNWLFFFSRLTNLTGLGGFTKSDATDEF